MLSMTQLKSAVKEINFYNRSRSNHSSSIFIKKDTDIVRSYRLKKMISKQFIKRRDTKYLIKWKEYDKKYNEWRNLSEMKNAINLIREYENLIGNTIHLFERLQESFVTETSFFVILTNIEMILRKSLIVISFTTSTSIFPPTTAKTFFTAMIAAHSKSSASSFKASTKSSSLSLQKTFALSSSSLKASASLRRSLRFFSTI